MAYIIDNYNKYDIWDREHSIYVFEINENWYAIKEIAMDWGLPLLPNRIDRDGDREMIRVYNTKGEAFIFAQQMKELNAR